MPSVRKRPFFFDDVDAGGERQFNIIIIIYLFIFNYFITQIRSGLNFLFI